MKFTTTQIALHAALKRVAGIAPSKATIPVLTNFLLELRGNALRITATDLEHTVITTLVVSGGKSGRVCLPADKLTALIKELPKTELRFEVGENHKIKIKTATGEYKLAGDDAKEFPAIKQEDYTAEFAYDAQAFARHVATIAFCASTDELRPRLMGMFLDARADVLRMVATDAYRLAKVEDHKFSCENPAHAIVPIKALHFVEKHAAEGDTVLIAIGGDGIRFKMGEITLYSKVISGIYLNYESVIPKDNELVIENIDTAELSSALRRAIIFVEALNKLVRVTFANNAINVEAEEQSSQSREEIRVEYDAERESVTIGCNAEYFTEILTHLKSERILLRFKDHGSAMIFEPQEQAQDEHKMMLLMPIRLDEK